jgi:hypothetical protein
MRPSTLFKLAFVAFAAAPTVYSYNVEFEKAEARDLHVPDHIIAARTLQGLYEEGHITARDIGEAAERLILERQLAGEDTQELEARLLSFCKFTHSIVPTSWSNLYHLFST